MRVHLKTGQEIWDATAGRVDAFVSGNHHRCLPATATHQCLAARRGPPLTVCRGMYRTSCRCGDGRYHCRRLSGAQSPQAQRSRVSGGPSRLQPLQQGPARGAVHARGGGGQAPPEPVRHHRGGHGPEPPHRQLWPGKDRRRIQIVGQGERGNGALSDARGGVVPRCEHRCASHCG